MPANQYGVTEFDQDPETAAELMRLRKQQQIADAMYGSSQAPIQGQMVGNTFVAPSITQGLAKLFQGYVAGQGNKAVEEGYKGLADKKSQLFADEVSRFSKLRSGTPEMPMGPPTEEGDMGVQPARAPATQQQITDALLSSRIPAFQKAGVSQLTAQQKPQEGFTLGPGQNRYDASGKQLVAGPAKEPTGKLGTEDVHIGGGQWQSYKVGKDGTVDLNAPIGKPFSKRPTATDVRVDQKVEQKTGESMAKEIGGMLKDSKVAVSGAIKMNDAADRILAAIETGNVTAGPLSSKIQTLRQFFDRSGGDKNDNVRQTRQVIRALAESSVEARKELQGQGQVTENEALAVQKAMSGDIDSLTVGELQDIANLNKRAAGIRAESHQAMLKEAEGNPSTKGLVGYYKIPGMDALLPKAPAAGKAPQGVDQRVWDNMTPEEKALWK
jgi:hypothetical protein